MGFVIDDPTKPQDVGEEAKKFLNEGSNINEGREGVKWELGFSHWEWDEQL